MARAKNTVETVQITISTTERVKQLLEVLTEEGLYGRNVAETASLLISEKMREMRRLGEIVDEAGSGG
ncbi:MAG: hypothetical protein KGS60_10655 [Verrucomicrobia bacterium]|jgi:hypothetical protein|nr:hypothetical protein [Verrucomicrobiota bacterium]